MDRLSTTLMRTAGLMALAMVFAGPLQAQSSEEDATPQNASVERVQPKYVCMITNNGARSDRANHASPRRKRLLGHPKRSAFPSTIFEKRR